MSGASLEPTPQLLGDIRDLIEQSRQQLASTVNSALILLYWHIGQRIRTEVLQGQRASYGEGIVSALARQLEAEYGRGFSEKNLRHMLRFAEVFPDEPTVSAARRQLSWTHLKALIYIGDPLKRDFYLQMCQQEGWSTRTLQERMDSQLFERTALADLTAHCNNWRDQLDKKAKLSMQLRHLVIPNFRNLRGLVIDFATHLEPRPGAMGTAAPKAIRSHALIGQNGTGKSNLIEALISIFRDVDLDRDAAFDYTLEYEIRGHVVRIQADLAKQRRLFGWVYGVRVSQDYLNKNDAPDKVPRDERRGPRLLPSHVFAYYSGRNERIEALFQDHQKRFNRLQEITTDEVLPEQLLSNFKGTETDIRTIEEAKKRRETRMKQAGDDRLRRLFYCRGGHSQLVLLACLLSDDPVFQKVLKNLHIESLESALFVLKEPYRLREKRRNRKFDEVELNEGDPRFWYARGSVVSEFLDNLWQVAWAPIEQEVTQQIDFRGRTEKQRQLYLYVPSQAKLQELGRLVGGTDSFFRYAEGAYIGDLIEEVRITVKKRVDGKDGHDGKVSFTQLSEGELQMLTVLGLMRITREDHCLFLLDEPDTHLNPIWKLRLFDEIDEAMVNEEGLGAAGESQVLLTTHDPILLGSLQREQVHILRRGQEKTEVDVPDEHPRGMGVAGLLKSDLFGLTSTLDSRTLDDLQRRNDLLGKQAAVGLTDTESNELETLRSYLEQLGFSREQRDPMYQLFVQKMYEARSQPMNQLLSPEQLQQQETLAAEIVEKLMVKEQEDELAELVKQLQKEGN